MRSWSQGAFTISHTKCQIVAPPLLKVAASMTASVRPPEVKNKVAAEFKMAGGLCFYPQTLIKVVFFKNTNVGNLKKSSSYKYFIFVDILVNKKSIVCCKKFKMVAKI
jgi:hypothetical protein